MNLSEFFYMSGYGFYVWSSFGLTFAMLCWQIVQPLIEQRAICRSIVKSHQRRQRQ